MTTARHLATIDQLRSRPYPRESGETAPGRGGAGYHLVELATSEDFWDDDGTRRESVEDQYEAERDALASLLTVRWGAPQVFSLWSVSDRVMSGEEIPDPWDTLSRSVPDVHLWRVDGHWIALGVSQWDKELPFQLVAAVTRIDPP
ncbi:hypothetical protein [Streptomyces lavendofoliae]|uniref:Uncharacterized protein n=1 Tax=Streptomyces lavendofoliae TaxID=67314 RepID=A0A918M5T2_9ACTN|nr:hypothetical protein [Streptomyces lavendofoliae]GGU45604.1 hypothetical protein GCM10010274_37130 [Streptomyces lavendofoliae]